ncbi:Transcriptional activator RfaH [Pseudomonas savastanoi pv. phaseolicola]|uniref:Transcriptional activator RfaH n=1 Tax=Pseudomonas savastanoi pv. phaseolicola TaxID=319 RepID=A0ABD4BCS0_PSESH|nr:Transcriptional activator RfaH [Pseudomonas savastanoi pv. phaseolicola]
MDNRGSEISDILSAKSHEERTLLLVGFLQRESLNKT